jgi:exodeoxyribonuclease-3/AP endonuclease-1
VLAENQDDLSRRLVLKQAAVGGVGLVAGSVLTGAGSERASAAIEQVQEKGSWLAELIYAGEGLKRLDFRVDEWERDMRAHLIALAAGGKPVVYGGDLNVAHADADIWNPTAKHIAKSAGTSPTEREAFAQMLRDCALVDTFRAVHPDAEHCYSYWSQRAGNRPFNRGLRLDYFLASAGLATAAAPPRLHDAFICSGTDGVSDHAPVGVVLAL